MLRGDRQALNCLSIHATYCVIIAWVSPGETKMWAAVRENGDFLTVVNYFITVVNYTTFAAIIAYLDMDHLVFGINFQIHSVSLMPGFMNSG